MKNIEAKFWLDEINAGTIAGAMNNDPSKAVAFFGSLPTMRGETSELRTIAGAAWRMTATDDQLSQYKDTEDAMFGGRSFDDMRAEMRTIYTRMTGNKDVA